MLAAVLYYVFFQLQKGPQDEVLVLPKGLTQGLTRRRF